MRVIIAGRLSREATGHDQTGFDSQESDQASWTRIHGHTVVAVVADFKSGRSGLSARPNLRPWITEPAKLAMYDAIVALKVDRLTRGNRAETAELEQWARDNNKALYITGSDVHFPSEGTEGIAWDLMLRMAHQEWLNTSERYLRMQRTLRDNKSLVGRAPYGYSIGYAVNDSGRRIKTLIPNPVEAAAIRKAATAYLSGDTLDTICDRLNATGSLPRGMRDGRQPLWVPKTLSLTLRNETMVGRRKNSAGVTELKCEPILDRGIWDRVIRRMDQRASRKGISQTKTPALLTSIIACGPCGKNIYRTNNGYYCRVKGCQTFVTLVHADRFVSQLMAADQHRDIIETVTSGCNFDVAIGEVKRDMAEAVQAEDFTQLSALRAELDRLRSLPAEPARVVQTISGLTVAEMWAAMQDDGEKRQYLLDRGARVTVVRRDNPKAVKLSMDAPWHQIIGS